MHARKQHGMDLSQKQKQKQSLLFLRPPLPPPVAQFSPREFPERRVPAALPVGGEEDRVVRELRPSLVAAEVEGDHARRVLGVLFCFSCVDLFKFEIFVVVVVCRRVADCFVQSIKGNMRLPRPRTTKQIGDDMRRGAGGCWSHIHTYMQRGMHETHILVRIRASRPAWRQQSDTMYHSVMM